MTDYDYPTEPWHRIGITIGKDDADLFSVGNPYSTSDKKNNAGIARRIVACINACAGIPTETLERCTVTYTLVLEDVDALARDDQ